MRAPLISFVLIKNKQVVTAETIEGDLDAIERRIAKTQDDGSDSASLIYGNGKKWDILFPMTDAEIEKEAAAIYADI